MRLLLDTHALLFEQVAIVTRDEVLASFGVQLIW